jgi:hypothetical protein
MRTAFVTNAGYDAFDENNGFTQFSMAGGRVIYGAGNVSVGLLAYWDYGTTDSAVRGEKSELDVHRLTLAPEVRLHLFPELYVFGRLAAGALRSSAKLEESTTGTELYARSWTFAADGTLGAALRAVRFGRRSADGALWLLAEGGYGWSPGVDLVLAPDEDDVAAPQRVAELTLGEGELAVRGTMLRLMVGVSF